MGKKFASLGGLPYAARLFLGASFDVKREVGVNPTLPPQR